MKYIVPSTRDITIFFSFPGSKNQSRKGALTKIVNERFFVKPNRKGSPPDYLCTCIKKILVDVGFFSVFKNRDNKFHLNIFIKEFQPKPFRLLIPKSKDSEEDVLEKILGKLKDIILENILNDKRK